jgi:hypothetical protein
MMERPQGRMKEHTRRKFSVEKKGELSKCWEASTQVGRTLHRDASRKTKIIPSKRSK